MSRARLCYKDALGAMILLYIVVMIIDAEMVSHLKSSGGLIARQDKDLFKVFSLRIQVKIEDDLFDMILRGF